MRSFFLAVSAAMILSACGGGGGGASEVSAIGGGGASVAAESAVRVALPQLVQDTEPAGPLTSMAGQVYFPSSVGDSWDYSYSENGAVKLGVNRSVTASTSAGFTVSTVQKGGTPSFQNYVKTVNGNLSIAPDLTVPLAAQTLIGNLNEFPEPFRPVGGLRVSIRQGNWGADLDGDGISESFRLEVRQIFLGFQTLGLPVGVVKTASFRNTFILTISPSKLTLAPSTITTTEDSWWALNIGLVLRNTTRSSANGGFTTTSEQLTGGTVSGVVLSPLTPAPPPPPSLDGTLIKISLLHKDLIYDATRNRYYASIPGSVVGNGNHIAIIDATTGAVTYSANPVGSDPASLAIAADGTALYAGLDGAGAIVKLSLPDMTELSRVQLPAHGFFGQQYAEKIAVSPVDADLVAVSMRYSGVSPRHAGVILMRGGVLQPRQTQGHTGSNLITFDSSGQFLYGYNNESTEFGLRKIQVFADGLAEMFVVSTASGFGNVSLEFSRGGSVLLGNTLWRASDLQLTGTIASPAVGCKSISTSRLACLDTGSFFSNGRILLADSNSFVILANLRFDPAASSATNSVSLVSGPTGQIAIRNSDAAPNGVSSIWLFSSPSL